MDLADEGVMTLSGAWQGQSGWDGWGVSGSSSSTTRELVDAAVDKVRWWAEQCDGLQGKTHQGFMELVVYLCHMCRVCQACNCVRMLHDPSHVPQTHTVHTHMTQFLFLQYQYWKHRELCDCDGFDNKFVNAALVSTRYLLL